MDMQSAVCVAALNVWDMVRIPPGLHGECHTCDPSPLLTSHHSSLSSSSCPAAEEHPLLHLLVPTCQPIRRREAQVGTSRPAEGSTHCQLKAELSTGTMVAPLVSRCNLANNEFTVAHQVEIRA